MPATFAQYFAVDMLNAKGAYPASLVAHLNRRQPEEMKFHGVL